MFSLFINEITIDFDGVMQLLFADDYKLYMLLISGSEHWRLDEHRYSVVVHRASVIPLCIQVPELSQKTVRAFEQVHGPAAPAPHKAQLAQQQAALPEHGAVVRQLRRLGRQR